MEGYYECTCPKGLNLIDGTQCVCPKGFKLITGPKCAKTDKVLVLRGYGTTIISGWNENLWSPIIVLTLQDMLIDSAPKEVDCFQALTDVETEHACPIVWENKVYLFGGYAYHEQISQLDGHVLKRIGTLTFGHQEGACTAIENKKIVLCFPEDGPFRCRRATGPLDPFTKLAQSIFGHHLASVSSSKSRSFTLLQITGDVP